jgi:Winged helix DNA-binding domain
VRPAVVGAAVVRPAVVRPAVVRARLAAQQLSGPKASSCTEVVTRVLAVQAQDPRGARLAVRSRSTRVSAADVDAALSDRRLLITWLNRGTLHLVTPDDYWWLHPLTTATLLAGNVRRLRQEGVSPEQVERGVDVVVVAVTADGPQTRAQLKARLADAGVPTKGQALVHLLLAASIRGHIVRGPMVDGEHAFVSVPHWLGDAPEPMDREKALALLARRYLAGHGPAQASDLAKWAGVPLGQARRGFDAIAGDLVASDDDLLDLAGRPRPPGLPPPRLLGPFDPLLHGWASREPFVGAHRQVVTVNGLFRPVALVDGRVVATWGLADGALSIRPLEEIDPVALDALMTDATAVLRFLGLPPRPAVIA